MKVLAREGRHLFLHIYSPKYIVFEPKDEYLYKNGCFLYKYSFFGANDHKDIENYQKTEKPGDF